MGYLRFLWIKQQFVERPSSPLFFSSGSGRSYSYIFEKTRDWIGATGKREIKNVAPKILSRRTSLRTAAKVRSGPPRAVKKIL